MELVEVYRELHGVFCAQIEGCRSFGRSGDAFYAFAALTKAARKLISWTLETREIPPGEEVPFERAARVFGTMDEPPKNLIVWHDRNRSNLSYFLRVGGWAKKTEETSKTQIASVGPFQLHNSVGADEEAFARTVRLTEKTVEVFTPRFDFGKTLYGNVFVVGQIKRAKHLAWYHRREDQVYVRVIESRGIDDARLSLYHELGHRYWWKFPSRKRKEKVNRIYAGLASRRDLKIRLPEVGEVFPIRVRADQPAPKVVGFDGQFFRLSTGGEIAARRLTELLERTAVIQRFPSLYSMTNVDEFFAECFSYYNFGTLNLDLTARFEDAVKG